MFTDLFSLRGRVALVSGGSRGIGKMIAAGFLSQGAAKVYVPRLIRGELHARPAPALFDDHYHPPYPTGAIPRGLTPPRSKDLHPAPARTRGFS